MVVIKPRHRASQEAKVQCNVSVNSRRNAVNILSMFSQYSVNIQSIFSQYSVNIHIKIRDFRGFTKEIVLIYHYYHDYEHM